MTARRERLSGFLRLWRRAPDYKRKLANHFNTLTFPRQPLGFSGPIDYKQPPAPSSVPLSFQACPEVVDLANVG